MKTLIAVCFVASISGCAAPMMGNKFDETYATSMKKGVTTKDEVRKNLGEPYSKSITPSGESWTYNFVDLGDPMQRLGNVVGITQGRTGSSILVVTFAKDRVSDYNFTKQPF